MKKALFLLSLTAVLATACLHKHQPAPQERRAEPISTQKNIPGDSTRYGLACDGCTDSILVFLPYSGGDPDTFDIIDAHQHHRIYGHPHIGDELAVIVNPEDTAEALKVFNMEELRGSWCYMVMPTFRNIENMPNRMRRRMLANIPDSLRKQWLKPREYMLRLKRDHSAMHYGARTGQRTSDDMTPVEYPSVRHYTEWRLFNGRLILKADTISGFTKEGDLPVSDTVDIELLRADSLVLRFPDATQSYYRKREAPGN